MITYITSHVGDFKGPPVVRLEGNEKECLTKNSSSRSTDSKINKNQIYYRKNINLWLYLKHLGVYDL